MMSLVPLMMLLMMHQPPLHQPWRLDRCNPFHHILQMGPMWAITRSQQAPAIACLEHRGQMMKQAIDALGAAAESRSGVWGSGGVDSRVDDHSAFPTG